MSDGHPVFDLWNHLRTAPPVAVDVGQGVRRFDVPGNLWLTSTDHLQEPLLVRRCVRKVWRRVRRSASRRILVTGTPGIGKSVSFINCALVRLAQAQHEFPVVVDMGQSGMRYVLHPDGKVEAHPEKSMFPELSRPTTWQFHDPKEGSGAAKLSGARTIVVSPPNQEHYKALRKDTAEFVRFFIYPRLRCLATCSSAIVRLTKQHSTSLAAPSAVSTRQERGQELC